MKDSIAGIDYRFDDPCLLEEALTHRSIGAGNNERLEFLGDSVLGMVVSSRLFERFPDAPEGDLTRMRAALVSEKSLAKLARQLGIGEDRLQHRQRLLEAERDETLAHGSQTVGALVGFLREERFNVYTLPHRVRTGG